MNRATFDQARNDERRSENTPSIILVHLLHADTVYAYQLSTMDTSTKFSSETVGEASEEFTVDGSNANVEAKGFFGSLVQSIFEVSRIHDVTPDKAARSQSCRCTRHERFFLLTSDCAIRSGIPHQLELPRHHDAGGVCVIMGVHDLVRSLQWPL